MDNPYASILSGAHESAQLASANPYAPIVQADTPMNPYETILRGDAVDQRNSAEGADEPWYSQAWDWANKPLLDLKRDGATGVEAGVEDFLSGFTSPLSLGLTIATFGAGGLLENLGINVAKMAAPEVLNAARTAGKLASVGFTAMQLKGIADASPSFVQAVKNGDTDKALEIGTGMVLNGAVAGLGAKHAFNEFFPSAAADAISTPKDQLIGRYQRMLKEDNEQALAFNREFKKAVPNVASRNAIQFYAEAGGDIETLKKWENTVERSDGIKSPALKQQAIAALRSAQDLSAEEIGQADRLRQLYDPDFDEASSLGLLSSDSRKTNYVARARWTDEPLDSVEEAKVQLGQGTQPNHLKQRVFSTTVDGLLAGKEPVKIGSRYAFDAADVAADYHRSIGREIAKKQFVEDALRQKAEDGRPFAVQGGTGRVVTDAETGEPGPLITNSNAVPDHPLTIAEIEMLVGTDALDSMIEDGRISDAGNGKYRFNTDNFDNTIRSPHTNGYAYGGAPDVLVKGPVAFHPDIADTARTILAPEQSKLRSIPGVNALMNVSSQAKQTLLSASGFHWVQEALRGVQSGINPLNLESWDMTNPKHVRLIEAGGLQPGIESGANAFTEGVKGEGLLAKVPGIGTTLTKLNHNLFGPSGFIDRLKLTASLKFAERLKEADPTMDTMTRYKVAGQMANARFGGLNYLAMGRSKEAQDILRLTLLAPDWLESQLRDTGLALQYPKLGGLDMARIALYNFAAARALNVLVSGKPHLETPFGVVSPDDKKVYSVRTLPEDLWHAVTDPQGFARNRLNPITTRTAIEAVTGKDKLGHTRTMGEQLKDLFSNITPIPLQGAADAVAGDRKPNSSVWDSVASAAGVSTRANYSPAESLAFKLSSERAGSGPVPSEQLARHHRILQIEDRLRSGDASAVADIQSSISRGELAPADAKTIITGSTGTRLQSVVRNLPLSNALDVWDAATKDERAKLAPIIAKKMVAYHRTERMRFTPSERARIHMRLAKLAGDVESIQIE